MLLQQIRIYKHMSQSLAIHDVFQRSPGPGNEMYTTWSVLKTKILSAQALIWILTMEYRKGEGLPSHVVFQSWNSPRALFVPWRNHI